ncbi:DUF2948 family protein [Litorimonas sp. RW-G-Af-16]|uniref:DUF2948 family protein n=1 Tax=Litorimonas sp. RW-G-Af-16 TaxID=3241168 RepID=UPI00390CA522
MSKLRLLAKDPDDLPLIASAVQDAILRVGDIRYDAKGRFLSLRLSRYMHETKKPQRIESGLRIDGVMSLQSKGVDRSHDDAVTVLLDATFDMTDAPAGTLLLTFAGGGAFRLSVEAMDITLADIGDPRTTKSIPKHDD